MDEPSFVTVVDAREQLAQEVAGLFLFQVLPVVDVVFKRASSELHD